MKQIFILLLLLISTITFSSDKVNFEIILFGNKIGKLTVIKQVKGDTTHYLLESNARAKVLWMSYIDYTFMNIKYVKDRLHSVNYFEDQNDKRKYFTNMVYDGKQYTVSTKNGTRNIVPEKYPSLLSLYFSEPKNISKIYFEAQLFATPVEEKKPGWYIFKTKEGNDNEYIYKNGVLEELILHTNIATVKMKRVE